MNDTTRNLLESAIGQVYDDFTGLEAGSREKSTAIDDFAKLYKLKVEENKNNADYDEKYFKRKADEEYHKIEAAAKEQQRLDDMKHRERELELKENQTKLQVHERLINTGLQLLGGIVTVGSYIYVSGKYLKFEEEGVLKSSIVKGWVSKLVPKLWK